MELARISKLSVFFLILMACNVFSASSEIIQNQYLESWSGAPPQADAWVGTNEPATLEQVGAGHSGLNSVLVTPQAAYAGIRQLNLPLAAGENYTMSLWIHGGPNSSLDGADVVRIMIVQYLSVGGPLFTITDTNSQGGITDSGWRYFELNFTTDPNLIGAELQFGAFQEISANSMSFYLDDVTLRSNSNPLPGGGMEAWDNLNNSPDSWLRTNEASDLTSEDVVFNGGGHSVRVTPQAAYAGIRQININLEPLRKYRFSCWIRGAGTFGDGPDVVRLLAVQWLNDGSPVFDITDTNVQGYISEGEWRFFQITFTTNPNIRSAEIQLGAYQEPAGNEISFFLDDCALEEIGAENFLNPGFEDWNPNGTVVAGWVGTNEISTIEQEAVNKNSGNYSALVTPSQAYAGIRQLSIAMTPGKEYTLTARLRGAGTSGDGVDNVRLLVVEYLSVGGPNFHVAGTDNLLNDDTFETFTLKFTTDPNLMNSEIQFGAFQDPGSNAISFYIDDVSLQESSQTEPTPTPPPSSVQGWNYY